MEESGGSSAPNPIKYPSNDPAWKYFVPSKPGTKNKNDLICKFCGNEYRGGVFRAKQHLAGGHPNALPCTKCPEDVRQEIKAYMTKKAGNAAKESSNISDQYEYEGTQDSVAVERSCPSNSVSMPSQNKKRKPGSMDMFVKKPSGSGGSGVRERQTTMNEAFNKELREKGIMAVANWMYDAAIPFNAVNYPSFQQMFDIACQHGPGFRAPTFHEVRVTCLSKAVDQVEEDYIASLRVDWKKYGCSLMVDGWTDKRQRTLINFLVNSPKGSAFIESIDASEYIKTGEKLAELIDGVIVKTGIEEDIIQVITDNAANMVLAGKILQKKRSNLYWTPCAAHCIDLMLEDIGKRPGIRKTMKKAMSVTAYVYVRPGVVHMMRTFTNDLELCRAGVTRFATSFLTLQRLLKLKDGLKNMFTSDVWTQSKWYNESDGKKVTAIILSPTFWKSVMHILKIYAPLVRVLRLVDGEKKPAMGYIYEAMDRAKEAIMNTFSKKEDYEQEFAIIDERWEAQLHRPLHAAGYFLNPEYFYKNDHVDKEVSKGFYAVMEKLVPEASEQDKISTELDAYRNAEGSFGLQVAVRQRTVVAPAVWWANFGADAPTLQKLAIKVLSLTCSSSGCERNWSIFENVRVNLVALSRDGSTMSTVETRLPEEGIGSLVTLKFWDRASQSKQFNLSTVIYEPHRDAGISSIAFRPTGHMVVSSSYGGDFKVWVNRHRIPPKDETLRSAGWTCHAIGSYKKKPMASAAFSSDGSVLAVAAEKVITLWDPDRNTLLAVIGESVEPIITLSFVGKSEYLVSASRGSKPQLTIWSMSKLCASWSYRLDAEAISCSTNNSTFAVLSVSKEAKLHHADGVILLFNAETPAPLSTWFVSKAQGGKLSYVLSSPKSEDEISETKAEDEVLAYINGAHEYVLFNPYGESESKLGIARQRDFSSLEDTERYGYVSMYGELPEFSLKIEQSPYLSVPSEKSWKAIFSGPSHSLPPLPKLCSDFLESLLERRTAAVE